MCPRCLSPRLQKIRQAILRGMEDFPHGVPPLELNRYLSDVERANLETFEQLAGAIGRLPFDLDAPVPAADLGMLLTLVKRVEDRRHERLRRRGRLEAQAEEILDLHRDQVPVTRRPLEQLLGTMVEVLSGYAERCASDLRHANPAPDCGHGVTEIVTSAPYRIVVVAAATPAPPAAHVAQSVPATVAVPPLVKIDVDPTPVLEALRSLFGRRALSEPIGEMECTKFREAEQQVRCLIGAGRLHPDAELLGPPLKGNSDLPESLRADFQRISTTSDWVERIFNMSYEPYRGAGDSDLRMGAWALTDPERLVRFLDGARNFMIETLNRYLLAYGIESLPLIAGRGVFALGRVRAPEAPAAPVVLRFEEVSEEYYALAPQALARRPPSKPRPLAPKHKPRAHPPGGAGSTGTDSSGKSRSRGGAEAGAEPGQDTSSQDGSDFQSNAGP